MPLIPNIMKVKPFNLLTSPSDTMKLLSLLFRYETYLLRGESPHSSSLERGLSLMLLVVKTGLTGCERTS